MRLPRYGRGEILGWQCDMSIVNSLRERLQHAHTLAAAVCALAREDVWLPNWAGTEALASAPPKQRSFRSDVARLALAVGVLTDMN